ncbi:Abi family protein [bacterium]|nr:Abi family protein [bacterium]
MHFIHNFQFDDLIGLFKFDRLLKDTINKLLQNVENKLRDGIIYHLLESIHTICSNNINLPFILLDDN